MRTIVTRELIASLGLVCLAAACASNSRLDYASAYKAHLVKDLDYPDLLDKLHIQPAKDGPLPFDPTQARYFPQAARALGLVEGETSLLKRNGFVMVDHGQPLTMARAYLEIYHADLPVFVSTDSILHALHRSYDHVLMDIEANVLIPNLEAVLAALDAEICPLAREPGLGESAGDLAVFVTVARNLLAEGITAGKPEPTSSSPCADATTVAYFLAKIAGLALEHPGHGSESTKIYGSNRAVDWSQFSPRGHYVKSPQLQAYFRAMMWLGRVDLAWNFASDRELRDAALLVSLLGKSGHFKRLVAMSDVVDFMVGRADSTGPVEMQSILDAAKIDRATSLASPDALASLRKAMRKVPPRPQQIRSQALIEPGDAVEIVLPDVFQLFGQRFVLDSFVLSKVVWGSIVYHGVKQERYMPSGLDVMAALGSNEAVVLLEPQIRQFNYASNLLAARRMIDGLPTSEWHGNAYTRWLDTLRRLYAQPESPRFPQVMRTPQWQRKQLHTTLASWSELRHNTILYAKQSYGGSAVCEYPEGYVEPYPDFFTALADLTRRISTYIQSNDLDPPDEKLARNLRRWRKQVTEFFDGFAKTMARLESIARKELQAQALNADEKKFLKDVIVEKHFMGCVPVTYYTGWYPKLIYGEPMEREPTVADVHTDPENGNFLEEGVGDARYLIIAIDNQQDRAVYVGPAYSYYEFTSGTRLTDEQWDAKRPTVSPPPFTTGFAAPVHLRTMAYPGKPTPPEPPPPAPEEFAPEPDSLE